MTNLSVARFVPGDAREVILGLEVFEADVPNEGAKGFDGVHFVALGANETKAEVLVGIFWESRRAVGSIVVSRVFKGLEAHIAQGHGPALKWFGRAAQRCWFFVARVRAGDSPDAAQKSLQMPAPGAEARFVHATFDISRNGLLGPFEHRLVVGENASKKTDRRSIGNWISIVDVLPVSRLQGSAGDLVNAHKQLGWI